MLTRRILRQRSLAALPSRTRRQSPLVALGTVPRRFSSTNTETNSATKPSFYKTFGRPVTKVLLMAMLTYQSIYLLWTKLEADEGRVLKQGEIKKLESEVERLQRKQE